MKYEAELSEGITLVNVTEHTYNIQHTNELVLPEVVQAMYEFLLASGFSDNNIKEYLNVESL